MTLDLLQPPEKESLLPKLPQVETIEVVEVHCKSILFKIEFPNDLQGFMSFQVMVNNSLDNMKLHPRPDNLYLYKGLEPLTKYTFTFRAVGKQKQQLGDWSREVVVETISAESVKEEEGTARQAKIKAEQKVMKNPKKDEKDEKDLEEKKLKLCTRNHDYHCDICLGWEGTLVCCDGSCRRSFHLACLGMDEEDNDEEEEWLCNLCKVGAKRCMICSDSQDSENMIHCKVESCKKYFHRDCLKTWNCEVDAAGRFTCPRHTCKACNQVRERSVAQATPLTVLPEPAQLHGQAGSDVQVHRLPCSVSFQVPAFTGEHVKV